MKNLGRATNCIGLEITYEDDAICLDQTNYIHQILKRFNMENCKSVTTPSDPNQKLSISMSPKT